MQVLWYAAHHRCTVRRCKRQHRLPKDNKDISLEELRRVLWRFCSTLGPRVQSFSPSRSPHGSVDQQFWRRRGKMYVVSRPAAKLPWSCENKRCLPSYQSIRGICNYLAVELVVLVVCVF